jgi:tetratricopeptide (TPR) repeat protein
VTQGPETDPFELHERAFELWQSGELAEAERTSARALELFRQAEPELAPIHPDTANMLWVHGSVLEAQGRYAEAEACGREAVDIMDKAEGQVSGPDIAQIHVQVLGLLGTALRQQGKYPEARKHLERAIRIAETREIADPCALSTALNNFGMLCKYAGDFDSGAAAYQRGLKLALEQNGGEYDDPGIAALLHNIGGLEHARGRFDAAEEPARRAWEIRRKLRGDNHLDTLADAVAYAGVLDGLERYGESRPIYERAIAIYEEQLGPDHFEVAAALNNLAGVEAACGNVAAAEAHFRRSLQAKVKQLGPEHPEVALTSYNLGALLLDAGREAEGRELIRQAVSILEKTVTPGHPWLEAAKSALA